MNEMQKHNMSWIEVGSVNYTIEYALEFTG